jgi:hypothetical protein
MLLPVVGAFVYLATSLGGGSAAGKSVERVDKSKVSVEAFSAEMTAAASYPAGKEGAVVVTVKAFGDFKINQQFPFRLKLADPPEGVTYPKNVLKRDDGTFKEKEATFRFAFVPQKAGKYVLSGTVSLSVCDDKKCLMEKVPLDVEVTVQ